MKNILSLIIIIGITISNFAQNSNELNIGDVISEFSGINSQGISWNSNMVKTEFLVVYFYPAAMTSGCTKQACAYRDNKTTFDKTGITVIGVSGDEVKNLKHFKESLQLNFPLLSDTNGNISKIFGVPTKKGGSITREIGGENYMLKRAITIPRWTFILDKSRKIIYKNSEVNATEDSQTVLEIIINHSN